MEKCAKKGMSDSPGFVELKIIGTVFQEIKVIELLIKRCNFLGLVRMTSGLVQLCTCYHKQYLLFGAKFAWIFICGHYLLRKANSFLRHCLEFLIYLPN